MNDNAPPSATTETFDEIMRSMYTPDGFSTAEEDPSWYSTD
ncbi:hypothetical protein [Glaciihabitans sp. UYNi722]